MQRTAGDKSNRISKPPKKTEPVLIDGNKAVRWNDFKNLLEERGFPSRITRSIEKRKRTRKISFFCSRRIEGGRN